MWETIQSEACQAVAYLPAEDKVNLGLALPDAPVIADPDPSKTLRAQALELRDKLEEANNLISTLQAQHSSQGSTTTKP